MELPAGVSLADFLKIPGSRGCRVSVRAYSYPLTNCPAHNFLMLHSAELGSWARRSSGALSSSAQETGPLDILLGGCGDPSGLLLSLHSAVPFIRLKQRVDKQETVQTSSSHSSRQRRFLNLHMNDLSTSVVARDLVILAAAVWCSSRVAFDVWAWQYVSEKTIGEMTTVMKRLCRLLEGAICESLGEVREEEEGEGAERTDDGVLFPSFEISKCVVRFYGKKAAEKILVELRGWIIQLRTAVADQPEARRKWRKKFEKYSGGGRILPGGAALSLADDVNATLKKPYFPGERPSPIGVNVTFRGTSRSEGEAEEDKLDSFDSYHGVHPAQTPLVAFPNRGGIGQLRKDVEGMMKSFRFIAASGHLSLNISVGDLMEFLDSPKLRNGQRFDYISTSNLSDYVGPLNILLRSRDVLKKGVRSFLEVQTMQLPSAVPGGPAKRIGSSRAFVELFFAWNVSMMPTFTGFQCCNPRESVPELRSIYSSTRVYFSPIPEPETPKLLSLDRKGTRGTVLRNLVTLLRDIVVRGGTVARKMDTTAGSTLIPRDGTLETFLRVLRVLQSPVGGVCLSPSDIRFVLSIVMNPEEHVAHLRLGEPSGEFDEDLFLSRHDELVDMESKIHEFFPDVDVDGAEERGSEVRLLETDDEYVAVVSVGEHLIRKSPSRRSDGETGGVVIVYDPKGVSPTTFKAAPPFRCCSPHTKFQRSVSLGSLFVVFPKKPLGQSTRFHRRVSMFRKWKFSKLPKYRASKRDQLIDVLSKDMFTSGEVRLTHLDPEAGKSRRSISDGYLLRDAVYQLFRFSMEGYPKAGYLVVFSDRRILKTDVGSSVPCSQFHVFVDDLRMEEGSLPVARVYFTPIIPDSSPSSMAVIEKMVPFLLQRIVNVKKGSLESIEAMGGVQTPIRAQNLLLEFLMQTQTPCPLPDSPPGLRMAYVRPFYAAISDENSEVAIYGTGGPTAGPTRGFDCLCKKVTNAKRPKAPPGFVVDSLRDEDIPFIQLHDSGDLPDEYLCRCLEDMSSVCLREKKSGSIVAWAMQYLQCEVGSLMVLPRYRRRGLATFVARELCWKLAESSYERVFCKVNVANMRAQRLLKKLGWKQGWM